MRWVEQSKDNLFPDWLSKDISNKCPECGSEMVNGYNEYDECTRRRCSNPQCIGNISAKIAKMCETLGVAGIREGKAKKMVIENRLKSHWEALSVLYDNKPALTPLLFLKCCFIYGLDSELSAIAEGHDSIEGILKNYKGRHYQTLHEYEDTINEGLKYVTIEKVANGFIYSPVIIGEVNITGIVPGYKDREEFIATINYIFRGLVRIKYTNSRRKTGLIACITIDKTATTGKIASAIEGGIPVLTPDEFRAYIMQRVSSTKEGQLFIEQLRMESE